MGESAGGKKEIGRRDRQNTGAVGTENTKL